MGALTATTLADEDDAHLIALYDAYTEGTISGLPISLDRSALEPCDTIVEFSRPDTVMENLAAWRSFGANVVVGTSGFDADRVSELRDMWGSGPGNCLVVPNFSIGAVLMMKLSEIAAPHLGVAEIIEAHHDQKAEAPSGTAIATAERIAAASGENSRTVDSEDIIEGASGADVDGIHVHSVRLPGLVAHQRVIFGGEGEVLSIAHDTTDRRSFMPGMLLAVRSIAQLSDPVSVGLEPLLKI
ncbi:MAG: 4-hydroxy-tetrahydrodipicolinate reductase [Acidimicrobiia bacterium]